MNPERAHAMMRHPASGKRRPTGWDEVLAFLVERERILTERPPSELSYAEQGELSRVRKAIPSMRTLIEMVGDDDAT